MSEKLDPELKDKWCVALRSGNYQQGQYRMRSLDNRFCCLGVLLDNIDSRAWGEPGNDLVGYQQPYELLPLKEDTQRTLWILNDSQNKTFPEIADWIEENL